MSIFNVARRRILRTLNSERRSGIVAIDVDHQVRILNSPLFDVAREPAERYPTRLRRSICTRRKLERSSRRRLDQLRAGNHLVHQMPIDGALASDAFLGRAEKICAVTPDA